MRKRTHDFGSTPFGMDAGKIDVIMLTPRASAIFKALFTVTMWGGSFIATKIAVGQVSPLTLIWLRFGIGVVILALVVLQRRQARLPAARDVGYFALLGFLGITFHQALQAYGLVTAQASTTAWIVATIPIFTALLGWLVLKEKLGWLKGLGIGLAAGGVLVVVSGGNLAGIFSGHFGAPGDLLILLSAPNWAVFSVLSRRGLGQHPPAWMMLWVMGIGWLLSNPLFFGTGGLAEVARLTPEGWLAVAFLGVICSGVAYIFWYDALAVLPATQVGAFIYLEPLVTVVVAALLLGEPITWASLVGGAVILLGIFLVQR